MSAKHSWPWMLLAIAAAGCDKDEPPAKETQERLEAQEEALREMAEGMAESKAALEGKGELMQEIEGSQAEHAMDEALDRREDAGEAAADGGT